MGKDYELYFFYKNRQKLRDSLFLDMFPKGVKMILLQHYKIENYLLLDKLLAIFKTVIVSLFYFVLYKATYIPKDLALGLSFTILGVFTFFSTLFLLDYNKRTIPDIEHDHYFRMLGKHRNDLVKQVMRKRINYAFLNWMIPFTLFPFVYAGLLGDYRYILLYLIFIIIFYFITNITLFLTQRLLYDYIRGLAIINSITVFYFLAVIIGVSIGLTIGPTLLFSFINIIYLEVVSNVITYVLILIVLYSIYNRVVKNALNYSLTNVLLLRKKSRMKRNQISNPNIFITIFYNKNDFQNKLLTKDLISFYRGAKDELWAILIYASMSIVYTVFLITTFLEFQNNIPSLMMIDNAFSVIISIFFILTLYRLKNITWYSSEGRNLLLYSKLNYDKYAVYKSKKKLNYIILSPIILFYIFVPIFFGINNDSSMIIYGLLRIPLLYLLFSNIIDYSILQDTLYPRKYHYQMVAGLGKINLITLIFMFQGIGLTYLLINANSISSFLGNFNNFSLLIYGILYIFLLFLKVKYIYQSKKLVNIFEGSKVYG